MDDDDWDCDIDVDALVEQHRQRDAAAAAPENHITVAVGHGGSGSGQADPAAGQWLPPGGTVTGATASSVQGDPRGPQPASQRAAQPLQSSRHAQPQQSSASMRGPLPLQSSAAGNSVQAFSTQNGLGQMGGWQQKEAVNSNGYACPQAQAAPPALQPPPNKQWAPPQPQNQQQPLQWPHPQRPPAPNPFGGSSAASAPGAGPRQSLPPPGPTWAGPPSGTAPGGLTCGAVPGAPTSIGAGVKPGNPAAGLGSGAGVLPHPGHAAPLGAAALKAQQIRDRWAKPKAHRAGVEGPAQVAGGAVAPCVSNPTTSGGAPQGAGPGGAWNPPAAPRPSYMTAAGAGVGAQPHAPNGGAGGVSAAGNPPPAHGGQQQQLQQQRASQLPGDPQFVSPSAQGQQAWQPPQGGPQTTAMQPPIGSGQPSHNQAPQSSSPQAPQPHIDAQPWHHPHQPWQSRQQPQQNPQLLQQPQQHQGWQPGASRAVAADQGRMGAATTTAGSSWPDGGNPAQPQQQTHMSVNGAYPQHARGAACGGPYDVPVEAPNGPGPGGPHVSGHLGDSRWPAGGQTAGCSGGRYGQPGSGAPGPPNGPNPTFAGDASGDCQGRSHDTAHGVRPPGHRQEPQRQPAVWNGPCGGSGDGGSGSHVEGAGPAHGGFGGYRGEDWQQHPYPGAAPAAAAATAPAGAAGGRVGSEPDQEDASLLDVPLHRRMQQRRSQPPQPPSHLQQPQQQVGQVSRESRQRQQTIGGPPAIVIQEWQQQQQQQQKPGQAQGHGGSNVSEADKGQGGSGSGYWDSMFGAGAKARPPPSVLVPPPARAAAADQPSPVQRRLPPVEADDPEMARALVAGEFVELPIPTEGGAGAGAAAWAGAAVGRGDAVLVASGGANEDMMLHAVHARTWLYPKDLPVREYQFALVRSALFHNTLVCLPTGLGKTLIAAVVMLNYYRWFPEGKIVFVAPTKPLVEQQLKACREKTCIPKNDIIQLTATRGPGGDGRASEWAARRVFFCTPQILENDIENGTCPKEKLVLLVVDECHRAVGKAAPVTALQTLRREHMRVRVVGLSATPGSNSDAVNEVIRSLGVSRVEFRSEEDPDVAPYCFRKQVDVMEVFPDDKLQPVAEAVVSLLRKVNAKLLQHKVVDRCDPENVGRFSLVTKLKQFQASLPDNKSLDKSMIPRIYNQFNQAIFLCTLLEHLTNQGAKMAADFVRVEVAKNGSQTLRDLVGSAEWKAVRQRLEECGRYSHPKMHRLEEVLLEHFGLKPQKTHDVDTALDVDGQAADTDAAAPAGAGLPGGKDGAAEGAGPEGPKRVIIFTTLRDTVAEIVACLERHTPHIIPRVFVGQGARGAGKAAGGGGRGAGGGRGKGRGRGRGAAAAGDGEEGGSAAAAATMTMNQEEQRAVLQGFRDGAFNVLVATCIGEEGLDIPEVDLIVCYDSSASPTRQVQRMGRTGRHREGRVVYVLAAGKETDNYYKSQEEMRRLQAILRDAPRYLDLCRSSPSMLPEGCYPRPVLLRLQEATAAVAAHQKQLQAAAKKQTGKRAAAAAVAGSEAAAGKRRKGAGGTAAAAAAALGDQPSAAQLAAARWGKRPVNHQPITIDDDEDGDMEEGGRPPGGDSYDTYGGFSGAAPDEVEDVSLAQRALGFGRKQPKVSNDPAAARGEAGTLAAASASAASGLWSPGGAGGGSDVAAVGQPRKPSVRKPVELKPLWGPEPEDEDAIVLPDWMLRQDPPATAADGDLRSAGAGGWGGAVAAGAAPGIQGVIGGGVTGAAAAAAAAVPPDACMAVAPGGRGAQPVVRPGAGTGAGRGAASVPVSSLDARNQLCGRKVSPPSGPGWPEASSPAAAPHDDGPGAWGGDAGWEEEPGLPPPTASYEPMSAKDPSLRESPPPPPQPSPQPRPMSVPCGQAGEEEAPAAPDEAAVHGCLPSGHIRWLPADRPNAKDVGIDASAGGGGCSSGRLWLSPDLTSALQILLGPVLQPPSCDPSCCEAADREVDPAGSGPAALEALLQPIADDEAAAVVAAAGDHPLARLAAAFLPEHLSAEVLGSVAPLQRPTSWRRAAQPGVRQGGRPPVPMGHNALRCTARPEAVELLYGSAPNGAVVDDGEAAADGGGAGGGVMPGHASGAAYGGPRAHGGDDQDDFDPDNIIMTLDVVPLQRRKPPPAGPRAAGLRANGATDGRKPGCKGKQQMASSTTALAASLPPPAAPRPGAPGPAAGSSSGLADRAVYPAGAGIAQGMAPGAAPCNPSAAGGVCTAGGDDDCTAATPANDGLQDVPLAVRRRLSAAAAASPSAFGQGYGGDGRGGNAVQAGMRRDGDWDGVAAFIDEPSGGVDQHPAGPVGWRPPVAPQGALQRCQGADGLQKPAGWSGGGERKSIFAGPRYNGEQLQHQQRSAQQGAAAEPQRCGWRPPPAQPAEHPPAWQRDAASSGANVHAVTAPPPEHQPAERQQGPPFQQPPAWQSTAPHHHHHQDQNQNPEVPLKQPEPHWRSGPHPPDQQASTGQRHEPQAPQQFAHPAHHPQQPQPHPSQPHPGQPHPGQPRQQPVGATSPSLLPPQAATAAACSTWARPQQAASDTAGNGTSPPQPAGDGLLHRASPPGPSPGPGPQPQLRPGVPPYAVRPRSPAAEGFSGPGGLVNRELAGAPHPAAPQPTGGTPPSGREVGSAVPHPGGPYGLLPGRACGGHVKGSDCTAAGGLPYQVGAGLRPGPWDQQQGFMGWRPSGSCGGAEDRQRPPLLVTAPQGGAAAAAAAPPQPPQPPQPQPAGAPPPLQPPPPTDAEAAAPAAHTWPPPGSLELGQYDMSMPRSPPPAEVGAGDEDDMQCIPETPISDDDDEWGSDDAAAANAGAPACGDGGGGSSAAGAGSNTTHGVCGASGGATVAAAGREGDCSNGASGQGRGGADGTVGVGEACAARTGPTPPEEAGNALASPILPRQLMFPACGGSPARDPPPPAPQAPVPTARCAPPRPLSADRAFGPGAPRYSDQGRDDGPSLTQAAQPPQLQHAHAPAPPPAAVDPGGITGWSAAAAVVPGVGERAHASPQSNWQPAKDAVGPRPPSLVGSRPPPAGPSSGHARQGPLGESGAHRQPGIAPDATLQDSASAGAGPGGLCRPPQSSVRQCSKPEQGQGPGYRPDDHGRDLGQDFGHGYGHGYDPDHYHLGLDHLDDVDHLMQGAEDHDHDPGLLDDCWPPAQQEPHGLTQEAVVPLPAPPQQQPQMALHEAWRRQQEAQRPGQEPQPRKQSQRREPEQEPGKPRQKQQQDGQWVYGGHGEDEDGEDFQAQGFGSFNLVAASEKQPEELSEAAGPAALAEAPAASGVAAALVAAATALGQPGNGVLCRGGGAAAGAARGPTRKLSWLSSTPGLSDLADAADVDYLDGDDGDGHENGVGGEALCTAARQRQQVGGGARPAGAPPACDQAATDGRVARGPSRAGGPPPEGTAAAAIMVARGASFRAPTDANITPVMRAKLQTRTGVAAAAAAAAGGWAAPRVPGGPKPEPAAAPSPTAIDLTLSPPVAAAAASRRPADAAPDGLPTDDSFVQCRRRAPPAVTAAGAAGGGADRDRLKRRAAAIILDDSSQEPPGSAARGAPGGGRRDSSSSSGGSGSGSGGSLFKRFARTPAGAAAAAGPLQGPGTAGRDTTPLVAVRRRVRRPLPRGGLGDEEEEEEEEEDGDGAKPAAGGGGGRAGAGGKLQNLRRLRTGAADTGAGCGGGGVPEGVSRRAGGSEGGGGGGVRAGPALRRPAGPAAAPAGANIAANRQRLLAAGGGGGPGGGAQGGRRGVVGGAGSRGRRGGGGAFIDAEAALSGDDEDDEGDGDEGEEEYESSFVTDGQGTTAGGSQSDAAGRSPASMLAIYRAPFMAMTQAPPSVVRPGDVMAMMLAQRRKARGGGPGGGGAHGAMGRRVVDTPGASGDVRRDEDSAMYDNDDDDDDGVDEVGDGDEEEEEEGGEEEEDPLTRRMARGLNLVRGSRRRGNGDAGGPGGRVAAAAAAGVGRGLPRNGTAGLGRGWDSGSEASVAADEGGEGEAEEEGEEEEEGEGDDDVCGVCGDPGHLMLCEGCDCAVHPGCVGLRQVPEGDWFCESCKPRKGRPTGRLRTGAGAGTRAR